MRLRLHDSIIRSWFGFETQLVAKVSVSTQKLAKRSLRRVVRPHEVARDLSMALWRIYNPDRTGNGNQSTKPFNLLTSFYTASAEVRRQ